jgi:mannose-6-phosphate isomerase
MLRHYRFQPVYQERLWGGRHLETLFGRVLPEGVKIGESWELCDRPETQSIALDENVSLHDLWSREDRSSIFGKRAPKAERFPILIKFLDASEKLSLQVHPPVDMAHKLGGEAKTEVWYFLHTEKEADIFLGLKRGVTREAFERAIEKKTVASCFHRLETAPGETAFLPSGRVHALGGGNVVLEIQQNSDTTYRVYDWDRVGPDRKPRALHVEQALQCINFKDYEPNFSQPHAGRLASTPYFSVQKMELLDRETIDLSINDQSFAYIVVTKGSVAGLEQEWTLSSSVFVPANAGQIEFTGLTDLAEIVIVRFP